MSDLHAKHAETVRAFQDGVIAAAEAKLERPLSLQERNGIRNLGSLMSLEALDMAFSHSSTTPERVKEDLTFLVSQLRQETDQPAA